MPIGWIVRIVILLILIRLAFQLVRGVFQGYLGVPSSPTRPKAPRGNRAVPLVKDPVCGTYVVPGAALTTTTGGVTQYFCSENCRRAYERDRARPA